MVASVRVASFGFQPASFGKYAFRTAPFSFRPHCAGNRRKWHFHTHITSQARGGEGAWDRTLNTFAEPCPGPGPFPIEKWARSGGLGRVKDCLKKQNGPVGFADRQ